MGSGEKSPLPFFSLLLAASPSFSELLRSAPHFSPRISQAIADERRRTATARRGVARKRRITNCNNKALTRDSKDVADRQNALLERQFGKVHAHPRLSVKSVVNGCVCVSDSLPRNPWRKVEEERRSSEKFGEVRRSRAMRERAEISPPSPLASPLPSRFSPLPAHPHHSPLASPLKSAALAGRRPFRPRAKVLRRPCDRLPEFSRRAQRPVRIAQ